MLSEILPTEDKDLAFSYIIMKLLVAALDKDISSIKNSKLKLKNQHVQLLDKVRNMVLKDIANVRREMSEKGVKVFDKMIPVNEDFVAWKYVIRGYDSEFRCFKSALKMHTEKKLEQYYDLI